MIWGLFSIGRKLILFISLGISLFRNRRNIANIMHYLYDDNADTISTNNVNDTNSDFDYPSIAFSDSASNIPQITIESDEYYKQRLHLCRQQYGYYDKNQSISILPIELEKTNPIHWTMQWLQKYIMPSHPLATANDSDSRSCSRRQVLDTYNYSHIKGRKSIHSIPI